MPFGFLALLAAFGTLANSLRSNSASVLIRTLLRCSARPNGGGYHTARPLRGPRPKGLFAALTSRGLGYLIPLPSLLTLGQPQGLPLRPHSSPLTLCFSPVASRVSARQPSYFLLLRQKKVTKEKASHVRALRVPCATRSVRDTCKLASLKQCKCLDPNAAPLLSTA